VMIAPCPDKRANTQLVIKFGPRNATAQISRADPKRNLCRLNVVNGGSWPLGLASAPAKEGDKVYAVTTAGGGETVVTDMRVTAMLPMEGGKGLELSVPVTPNDAGGPVIDSHGRVVGMIVARHDFPGKSVAIPLEWIQAIRPAPR
jgi:S1-C subfamily serine protease